MYKKYSVFDLWRRARRHAESFIWDTYHEFIEINMSSQLGSGQGSYQGNASLQVVGRARRDPVNVWLTFYMI